MIRPRRRVTTATLRAAASIPCLPWVLLRHRLLLQAEVGEGAVAVEVGDELRYATVPDAKDRRCLSGCASEREATGPAAPRGLNENKNALVVEFPVLLRFGAVALPGVEE